MQCSGDWVRVFRWEEGRWTRGKMQRPKREWLSRSWGSANTWAEVFDINTLRQLLENANEQRLGQQRLNAAQCLLGPLMTALSSIAAACGSTAPKSAPLSGSAADAAQPAPNAEARLGSVSSSAGSQGREEFGGVSVEWHEFSTRADSSSARTGVVYEVALEPLELHLAMAAPQIALPNRSELTRLRLLRFATMGDISATVAPKYEMQPVSGLEAGGYPPWVINQMVALENPDLAEAEKAAAAALLKSAEREAKKREELRRQQAAAADASSELPQASQAVLLGSPPQLQPVVAAGEKALSAGSLNLDNITCRSNVVSSVGEVIGEQLGDCVTLRVSQPLVNGVELCIPLAYSPMLGSSSNHGQMLGTVFDFARRQTVPRNYTTAPPQPLSDTQGTVPGQLGAKLWSWESGQQYGRLQQGWTLHTPLGLDADMRFGGGGTQMCAKVFEANWTYCPIVRLLASTFSVLPSVPGADGKMAPPMDSSCLELDAVLHEVQRRQLRSDQTSAEFIPMDMQVSNVEALRRSQSGGAASNSKPRAASAVRCPPGRCLAPQGRGFAVLPAGSAGCAIQC